MADWDNPWTWIIVGGLVISALVHLVNMYLIIKRAHDREKKEVDRG